MAGGTKNNKMRFCRYISQKRKTKKTVLPLINKMGELVTADTKKAEVLNIVFTLVFAGSHYSYVPQVSHVQNLKVERMKSLQV